MIQVSIVLVGLVGLRRVASVCWVTYAWDLKSMLTWAVALCSWHSLAMAAPQTGWHHQKPHHSGDQGTASATASTEARMRKPSVLPLLDVYHSPAYMEAETTTRMPKPSVPPQPDGDHNPASPTTTNFEDRPRPITLECVDNLSNNRTVQGHTEKGTIFVIEALRERGYVGQWRKVSATRLFLPRAVPECGFCSSKFAGAWVLKLAGSMSQSRTKPSTSCLKARR
jgi:hypothetical protein